MRILIKFSTVTATAILPLSLLVGCGASGGGSGGGSGGNAANDNIAPVLAINAGSTAGEGSTDVIVASELSYRDETQPPASVRFTVTVPPSEGQLETTTRPYHPINEFTQADIDSGRLIYRHMRGKGDADDLEFNVTDGQGNALSGQRFTIDIIPNIESFVLDHGSATAVLSWTVPLGANLVGVEIRRSVDGHYPASPTDGVLISRAQVNTLQVTDDVSYDPDNGPAFFYYTAFSYSADGTYSGGVRVGLYCDLSGCVTVPELRDLNNLHSVQDVNSRRITLLNAVWGVSMLPDWMPDAVTGISDTNYPSAQDIKELRVDMDYGLTSRVRYYSPAVANSKLIIFHQGHRGTQEIPLINRLLQEGFHVMQVSMLFSGYNSPNPFFPTHDDLAGLARPMRFFLEPVAIGLNYVLTTQSFGGVYMMGISGGGWTTIVYTALDPRIKASYPVAGSYPFYLRSQVAGSVGDFEQTNPDFYRYVSYPELYVMGATGRRQLQIYIEFDNCCFGGTFSNTFKDFVTQSVSEVGGSFDIIIDDTFVGHDISSFALEKILVDIDAH